MSEAIKEKEPAAAATATSSKENNTLHNNTTDGAKCQALTGTEAIRRFIDFVYEWVEDDGVITSIDAYQNKAELRFEYGGKPYVISFRKCFCDGEF